MTTENEKTTTTKTTTRGRAATRSKTATAKKDTAKTEPKVEAKKSEPKKVKEYTAQTMIPCRSVRQNILFYQSPSGSKYQWEGYGDIKEMPFEEVRSMLVSRSKFLFEPWLLIEDDELMETPQFKKALGDIKAAYDDTEDMQEFFSRDIDEVREKLTNAPRGLQQYIAFNANRYINDGTLDRVSVVRVVDEVLGTNLKMMM